jgi:hypothetical protein
VVLRLCQLVHAARRPARDGATKRSLVVDMGRAAPVDSAHLRLCSRIFTASERLAGTRGLLRRFGYWLHLRVRRQSRWSRRVGVHQGLFDGSFTALPVANRFPAPVTGA